MILGTEYSDLDGARRRHMELRKMEIVNAKVMFKS